MTITNQPILSQNIEGSNQAESTQTPALPAQGAGNENTLTTEQDEAVQEIGRLHDGLQEATRVNAAMAIELGERLAKLKKGVGRRWMAFAKAHLPFDVRTAERYMKVYENRHELGKKFDNVSNLRVSEAYAALTEPAKKSTNAKQQEDDESEPEEEGAPGKATIITSLTRNLQDKLNALSAEKIRAFEADLRTFWEAWLKSHQEKVEV